MSQGEEDHEDDHGKPTMLLWEVAEQGIKCYAEKRGKQLRVQEAAAQAREDQRKLREAAKNALRKGSAGKERSKENAAAKSTPQEVQSFSDEELKQKRNGEAVSRAGRRSWDLHGGPGANLFGTVATR
jgi:hypothetical protein